MASRTRTRKDRKTATSITGVVLAQSARDLPWRRNPDPYSIWVSEIMPATNPCAVVVDRYQIFLARFPTLVSAGPGAEQDVLAL